MASKQAKQTAHQPNLKLAFDIEKPIKIGFLLKQGGKANKSFKQRFFVLYTNFLVYYSDERKWQFDKTVGNLGSRSGAIKLTGGRCSNAMEGGVPTNCKFGFVVHAPDPTNKREAYLLDTTSSTERDSWVEAISGVIAPKPSK